MPAVSTDCARAVNSDSVLTRQRGYQPGVIVTAETGTAAFERSRREATKAYSFRIQIEAT